MSDITQLPTVAGPSLTIDPALDRLRHEEPVARVRLPYGEEAWAVTKHDDVKTVYDHPAFCRRGTTDERAPRVTSVVLVQPGTLNSMDDEEHKRLRSFVGKVFTPRRVEALRPRAQEITDGLLDEMVTAGGTADLVESLALPLPIGMICELLGVPYDDRDSFRGWSDAFMSEGLTSGRSIDEVIAAFTNLSLYLGNLINERRSMPQEDLLSALATFDDGTDRLQHDEVVALSIGLLVGGFETTAHMIGKSVYKLLLEPGAWKQLHEQPDLVPTAVEELLRTISLASGTSLPWCTQQAITLSGVELKPGDFVVPGIGSANRDESVYADPDALDIARSPNPHLAFGHGAHFCIGAGLARMELQVALGSLAARFPNLALAGDPPWRIGSAVWGLQALPVTF